LPNGLAVSLAYPGVLLRHSTSAGCSGAERGRLAIDIRWPAAGADEQGSISGLLCLPGFEGLSPARGLATARPAGRGLGADLPRSSG